MGLVKKPCLSACEQHRTLKAGAYFPRSASIIACNHQLSLKNICIVPEPYKELYQPHGLDGAACYGVKIAAALAAAAVVAVVVVANE